MPTTQETTPEPNKRGFRLTPRGIGVLAVLVVLLIGGGAATYMTADRDPAPPAVAGDDGEAAPLAAPEPEETEKPSPYTDPASFVGQDVNLSGVVTRVYDPFFFQMEDDGNTLLVGHRGNMTIKPNRLVYVQGVLNEFVEKEMEEALVFDLDSYHYTDISADYAIAAASIQDLGKASEEIGADGDGSASTTTTTDAPPTFASTTTETVVSSAPTTTTSGGSSSTTTSSGSSSSSSSSSSSGSSGNSGSGGSGGGSGGSTRPSGGGNDPVAAKVAYKGDEWGQYSDDSEFRARVTDGDGNPIENARVTFELRADNGTYETFRARTDDDGIATRTRKLTRSPGTYRLITRYRIEGDRRVRDKTSFDIERDASALDLTVERSSDDGNQGQGNDPKVLVATLTDADGGALAGRTVDFFANGELIGSANTDDSGTARFELPEKDRNDNADYSAAFSGDEYYLASQTSE